MNYVKKLFINKYTLFTILIIILLTISLILINRKNKDYFFLIYPKEHSILSKQDNSFFTIEIYSNEENSDYLKKETIDNIKIYDFVTKDYLTCNIDNIENVNEYINYDKNKYYKYKLNLILPIKQQTELNFNEAYLKINYLTNETISLYLGNFNVIEYKTNNAFMVNRMKGVINQINKQDTLVGIYLELTNTLTQDIIITNIDFTSNRIITNYDYLSIVDEIVDNYQESINNIVNEEYQFYQKSDKIDCSILIEKNKKQKIFIPLTYLKDSSVNQTGIIITYQNNGINYQQIIDPFVFFNSIENNIEVEKVVYSPN